MGADHPGFSAVAHLGPGVYTLVLTNFPANANNLIINATLLGTVDGGEISWINNVAPNTIAVRTYNSAGAPTDQSFTVTAFDTTP